MPIIELKTNIAAPKHVVFNLSRSIDFHKLSTAETNEEAIAGVTTGLIGYCESVTWRAKHLGVYQKLTVKITELDSPNMFVDEMVEGAFKSFRHEHLFESIDNGTIMTDIFDYCSPFGVFGKIADKLFLESYMRNFLAKRNENLKEFAESGKWKTLLEY